MTNQTKYINVQKHISQVTKIACSLLVKLVLDVHQHTNMLRLL